MDRFRAFRIFNDDSKVQGRVVETTLDELTPGDVVIKAAYSSVNYKDALAATGPRIIRTFPRIGGIDVAGTVVSSADRRCTPGDEVIVTGYHLGVANDGGYGEYVRVSADWVVPVPHGLTLRESMAIGTAGFTAALAIVATNAFASLAIPSVRKVVASSRDRPAPQHLARSKTGRDAPPASKSAGQARADLKHSRPKNLARAASGRINAANTLRSSP